MKLQKKFKKIYGVPLIIIIILSIIISVVILMVSSAYFDDYDSNLFYQAKQMEMDKTIPVMQSIKSVLFKKFQQGTYYLESIGNYFFDSLNNREPINLDKINKYLLNSIYVNRSFPDIYEKISGPNNTTYLDYGIWHVDDKISTLEEYKNTYPERFATFKIQLNVISTIKKIIRSYYEVSKDNLRNKLFKMYIAFPSTFLFFQYPITHSNKNPFTYLFSTPSVKCKRQGVKSTYYNFQCRDWYTYSVSSRISETNWVFYTSPYKSASASAGNQYAITICYRFIDPTYQNNNAVTSQYGLICSDIMITDIIALFNDLNRQITGYFFLMLVNSSNPIYHPKMLLGDTFYEIERYEFDINSQYYVEEAMLFTKYTVRDMIKDFNRNISTNPNSPIFSGSFRRNLKNISYSIYPLQLYPNATDPKAPIHSMSIVYNLELNSVIENLNSFLQDFYPRIIILIFLFLIMAGSLILVSIHFIDLIAKNIIKPIKNLKDIIKGMKGSDTNEVVDEEEDTDKKEEDNEENFYQRSAEIDDLFNLLLKLKNVLYFTSSQGSLQNNQDLINYINAKYAFNEVSNMKGKYLCDSNIGNLSNQCEKYDKAIFHLLEALKENPSLLKTHEILDFSILLKKEKIRHSSEYKEEKGETELVEINDQEDKKKFIQKKADNYYLNSRYPKLLFAYEKFFKIFQKIANSRGDFYNEEDLYVMKNRHTLFDYEKTIQKYLNECFNGGHIKKTAEALLIYNNFLISYKLQDSSVIKGLKEIEKEEALLKISKNFEAFDLLIKEVKYSDTPEYLEKYLNFLKKSESEDFSLGIPSSVLIQKANYIKGKFLYITGHVYKSVHFFAKSRETQIICDAYINLKSTIKIRNILEEIMFDFGRKIEKKQYNLRTKKLSPKDFEKENKKIEIYNNYKTGLIHHINQLEQSLINYQDEQRDILILIDLKNHDETSVNLQKAFLGTHQIIENYLTPHDKFCVFSSSDSFNPIIVPTQRNENNLRMITHEIDHYFRNLEDVEVLNKSKLFSVLLNSAEYLCKKSANRTEKIIIAFSDINLDSEQKLKMKETVDCLKNKYETNLIILGVDTNKETAECLIGLLNDKLNAYIDIDNMNYLKKILRKIGIIDKKPYIMQNEVY